MLDRKFEINYLRKEIAAARAKAKLARSRAVSKLVRKLNALEKKGIITRSSVYFWARGEYGEAPAPYCVATLIVENLDSFYEKRLCRALEFADEIAPIVKSDDEPAWMRRTYRSEDKGDYVFRVEVVAILKEAPKGCKRVEVGEKTIPARVEKVYKLVCN